MGEHIGATHSAWEDWPICHLASMDALMKVLGMQQARGAWAAREMRTRRTPKASSARSRSAGAPAPHLPFSPALSDRTLDFTTPEAPPAALWHSSALQPVAGMQEEVSMIEERLVCSERLPDRGWEPPDSLTGSEPACLGGAGAWARSGLARTESQQELEAAFQSISPAGGQSAPDQEERLPQNSTPLAGAGGVADFVPDTASPAQRASRRPALAPILDGLQEEGEPSGSSASMDVQHVGTAPSGDIEGASLGAARPSTGDPPSLEGLRQEARAPCRSTQAFAQSLAASSQVGTLVEVQDAMWEAPGDSHYEAAPTLALAGLVGSPEVQFWGQQQQQQQQQQEPPAWWGYYEGSDIVADADTDADSEPDQAEGASPSPIRAHPLAIGGEPDQAQRKRLAPGALLHRRAGKRPRRSPELPSSIPAAALQLPASPTLDDAVGARRPLCKLRSSPQLPSSPTLDDALASCRDPLQHAPELVADAGDGADMPPDQLESKPSPCSSGGVGAATGQARRRPTGSRCC